MRIKNKPKALILRTAGTNCDMETAHAFEISGAIPERVHINQLIRTPGKIRKYSIIALPGGFSYGDDIASGKILANEIRYNLKDEFVRFINSGKIIIGICNGFQVLVKSGFLPNINGSYAKVDSTLSLNDSAKFEDRWVYLRSFKYQAQPSRCVWTKNIEDIIFLPIAHGEGKFIPRNSKVLNALKENRQIVFQYCDALGNKGPFPVNPNGSVEDIAGICDRTGHVFGLMPHPERHIFNTQHPFWTRLERGSVPDGLKIFRNGVEFIKQI